MAKGRRWPDGSAAPGSGACTSMASCTAIPHDGRNARGRHAGLQSQRRTESQHGTASKARSRPAAPQHHAECSCRPGTLVFTSGITSSDAEFSCARCACRALGKWTAQSVTLHSWCSGSAEHGTAGRHQWNAWNAPQPARRVTARQRCVTRTNIPTHATASFWRRPLAQSGRSHGT